MVDGRTVLPSHITSYEVRKTKTSFHVIVAREVVYNYDLHSRYHHYLKLFSHFRPSTRTDQSR